MNALMQEIVRAGGMMGTRAEYVDYLVSECGWTLQQAVQIAIRTKAAQ